MLPQCTHAIFIATEAEASHLLHTLHPHVTFLHSGHTAPLPHLYLFRESTVVVITGVGPYAAHRAVEHASRYVASLPQSWLNIGIAGAIDTTALQGQWVSITHTSLLHWHPKDGFSFSNEETLQVMKNHQGDMKHLITSPLPVHDRVSPSMQGQGEELYIDMEGFALAQQAQEKGAHMEIEKIISDHCSKASPQEIRDQLPLLSHAIAEKALAWLEKERLAAPTASPSI